jgi:hypothetical protein
MEENVNTPAASSEDASPATPSTPPAASGVESPATGQQQTQTPAPPSQLELLRGSSGRTIFALQKDARYYRQALDRNPYMGRAERVGLDNLILKTEMEIDAAITRAEKGEREAQAKAGEEMMAEQMAEQGIVPDLPSEGHPLAVPETLTNSQKQQASEWAEDIGRIGKSAGIGASELEAAFHYAIDADLNGPGGITGENPEESYSVLLTRFGKAGAEAIILDAQAMVRKLGAHARAWLDEPIDMMGAKRGNQPAILQTLAELHRGSFRLNPESARKQIQTLRASELYQKGDPTTVAKMRALHLVVEQAEKRAARGNAPKQPRPTITSGPPTQSAKAKVEARIKELRSHPAYFDKSHASHKEVVAQVSALYGQLGS